MKRILIIIFIATLTFFSSCSPSAIATKKSEELKVMAWNIWHGGHQELLPSYGCKGALGILKQIDADVILMVETYGASANVADELGYYHRLLSSNLSIYSRYPITETYTFADSIATFNFGGVEIDMNGTKIRLFDTWLSGRKGRDEIQKILSVLAPCIAESDEIPIIIGGDFNMHSHLDWTEVTKDMYGHNGVVITQGVSKKMEKAGFKDSFREMNPDPVKNIGTTWMHPPNDDWKFRFSAMERTGKRISYKPEELRYARIDYIYYQGGKLEIIASDTHYKDIGEMLSIKGEEFFYPSDHGIVLTTFRLKE